MPVTISSGSSAPTTSPGTIIESDGTDVVAGNESNTNDPGKTIFVPGNSGEIVVPTQEDPSVLAPGGIPVTITGGSDGVVVIPGGQGTGGGATIYFSPSA
ncbi:hypothetical protein N0V93_009917 [Gnomoniopsis smithogilvyi]|uniref:Uncharacterized protein n=1 Tax=Gnomoniopsis smithogilvyi TaxID=1191159 RepID=A0A9W8YIQ1_9PEZI|nr:hypothetical protein N0V93_009917 [Gnomoniopsis smithogilvyi]